MPKILKRLVSQLKAKGKSDDSAWAIATSQLQKHGYLAEGVTGKAHSKGEKRNSMTASERAKDRQAKYDGHKPSDYKYDKKTNLATLRKKGK